MAITASVTETSAYIIERTAKKMKLAFSRVLGEHPEIDVTVDQWVVLQILDQKGTMNQIELADESYKDAPTITRILDKLEEKGYLTRSPNPADRRQFIITLTKEGFSLVHKIYPLVYEFRSGIYEGLTSETLEIVESAMQIIEKNINSKTS